jgi:hypothetical protein
MPLHPLGQLWRTHQAELYRDLSEVRGADRLLVTICRSGQTAEHGDDLHHKRPPVAAIGIGAGDRRLTGALSPSSLTESAGGKDAIVYRAGFSNVAGSLAFRL